MRRSDTKDLSIAEIHVSERSLANAHRVCEYDLEDRLQLPGRRRDDLQHLGLDTSAFLYLFPSRLLTTFANLLFGKCVDACAC